MPIAASAGVHAISPHPAAEVCDIVLPAKNRVPFGEGCTILNTDPRLVSGALQMSQHQPIRKNIPPPGASEIPDKLYFRIGEVARLCDIPAYVLRFWESEFPQLKPHKGGTGQRLYRRRDVETVLHIKSLLYDEGYTIPGARQAIKTEQRQKTSQLPLGIEAGSSSRTAAIPQLRRLQKDLRDLLAHLSSQPVQNVQSIRLARKPQAPRSAPRRSSTAESLFEPPQD
jgi:DNA-binding transcriptional MerR regulator